GWMSSLRGEIDHYHEKKEAITDLRSALGNTDIIDSGSDVDSFYGSVERPININYSQHSTENSADIWIRNSGSVSHPKFHAWDSSLVRKLLPARRLERRFHFCPICCLEKEPDFSKLQHELLGIILSAPDIAAPS
ncbi:hypothetical protein lerEdw1_014865, partial [Lerista edwardsae]